MIKSNIEIGRWFGMEKCGKTKVMRISREPSQRRE